MFFLKKKTDDNLDDVMILGTTPQFGSTPRYPHMGGASLKRPAFYTSAAGAAAGYGSNGAIPGLTNIHQTEGGDEEEEDDSSDDEMMGMSPDMGMGPGGLAEYMQQHQVWSVFFFLWLSQLNIYIYIGVSVFVCLVINMFGIYIMVLQAVGVWASRR